MSKNAHLLPDPERFETFIKGNSTLGTGKFWLVNMLRFKEDGGADEYKKYDEAVQPLMEAVGEWNGVFIGEYPSPSAFLEFSTSDAYKAAHKYRAAALEKTEMYAVDGFWTKNIDRQEKTKGMGARAPNLDFDMTEPQKLAEEKQKDKSRMQMIRGQQQVMIKWAQEPQFASGRIWQLNLLKYEDNPYYAEYAARASAHLAALPKSGEKGKSAGGGLQIGATRVFSLRGPEYDQFAVMQYPSREAFFAYASGGDMEGASAEERKGMSGGFALRTAGLAVQVLVCLGPESDPGAVQDPEGPEVEVTGAARARL